MRKSTVIVVILVAALAAFAAWRALAPASVEVTHPRRGMALDAVYATGIVEPSLEIRIAPRAPGRLVELNADEGDVVQKGSVLARLEDVDVQAQVAELRARVEYAEAQHERNSQLRRRGLLAQEAVDRSRSELDAARAALQGAQDQLGFLRLVAPADGLIIRRDGEVGEYIPVNETVFYMAGDAPLRITADVDEEDVPRVVPGQEVLIGTDAFPNQIFSGTVQQITPRGDRTARSYRVRIALPGDPPLKIGMTVETNIVIERRPHALLVPTTAVDESHVWVVENERARRVRVETGVVAPASTEIRAGLAEDAQVIVHPPENLEDGARVKTRTAPGDARPSAPPPASQPASSTQP